jgi:cold shock CspA family protein
MKLPLQIAFRHVRKSEELEASIREQAARLERSAKRITSCRVVVERPHRHRHDGTYYQVHLDITVPDHEIAVSREAGAHLEAKKVGVAIRAAFDCARRQLEDQARRRRGAVKEHAETPHARVASLSTAAGYGFLETPEGRQVYFHEHSVPNHGFDRLQVGSEVTFVEKEGQKGPQASTVKLVSRHQHL